jgi:hypothetical protein
MLVSKLESSFGVVYLIPMGGSVLISFASLANLRNVSIADGRDEDGPFLCCVLDCWGDC